MPRKPNGERAMTKAERDAAYRARKAAALTDAIDRILAARTLTEAKAIARALRSPDASE